MPEDRLLRDGKEKRAFSLVKAQQWSDREPQLEEGDSCKMFAGAVWLVMRDFVCGPAFVGRQRIKICLTSGNSDPVSLGALRLGHGCNANNGELHTGGTRGQRHAVQIVKDDTSIVV